MTARFQQGVELLPGSKTVSAIRLWLTRLGVLAAHPAAFLVVGVYAVLWVTLDPRSFGWESGGMVATLFMTLLIQRAEHRDTQAIHAKLDELLRATGGARDALTRVDEEEPERIEQHRARARARVKDE
jgi:low affinity Fe/Cu permease